MKRVLALAPLFLLAPSAPAYAGGGCHPGGPSALVESSTVKVEHACFLSAASQVAVGGTVTWLNGSGLDHNVGGPGIEFAELPNGGRHAMTFRAAGLYPYACTLHPGMSGVVVVGAAPDVTAPAAPAVTEPAATNAPAVQPVAARGEGGGGSLVPWAVGGAVALVAVGAVVTFARRAGRVPLPAR